MGRLGAAFGPLILFALYSKDTTWQSALSGIVTGTIVLIAWENFGLNKYMYEIVPGFLTNVIVILIVNRLTEASDEAKKTYVNCLVKYRESL